MIKLSPEQEAASSVLAGPVRIVAGAGTGKTAVIARRYRRLLDAGVEPEAILVMTFAERAAAEMRSRIFDLAGVEPVHVGTFHSLALRWLREEAPRLGLRPGFRILAGTERWIFMRELMWELGSLAFVTEPRPDDLVTPLLKTQERLKQELIPLPRLAAAARRLQEADRRERLLDSVRLFQTHADRCRREGLLDFDDLLLLAVRMLESDEPLRESYARRFQWLMVDEYQDTNLAQERLVQLLAGPAGNVCVVGDDDQSIYRFRGASRASMEGFLARYPVVVSQTLGRNHRSSMAIVAAAGELVEKNTERLPKPLLAAEAAPAGEPVEVWHCPDSAAEARAVASGIGQLREGGMAWGRIAVLTRTHAAALPVLAALKAAAIPFQHRGGQGYFRRPEVKDLVCYLLLLDDPGAVLALARLLARPPLSLDQEEAVARLRAGAADGLTPLGGLAAWEPAASWASTISDLAALKGQLGVDELFFELMNRTRYLEVALPAEAAEAARVVANVSRFAEMINSYCERRRDHSLGIFNEYLRLVLLSGVEEEVSGVEDAGEAVQVMSIHQAKGLEFDAVFVPGMVEGRLPMGRRRDLFELPATVLEPSAREREDHLSEERRLCYVAMTRARLRLFLSWAERYEGSRQWRRSRFLDELGSGVREVEVGGAEATAEGRGQDGEAVVSTGGAEEGGVGDAPELVLSYSGISRYRECPRQFWFRYRLHLPVPPAVEAQFGTVLHDTLMRAGRLRQQDRPVSAELLREIYSEAWDEVVLAEPRRRSSLEELGWRLLERFLAGGGLRAKPHLIEHEFTTSLDGWTLRGIIDRIDPPDPPPTLEGGGWGVRGEEAAATTPAWRLIDYKSGTPVPASRLRRDLQLALYALGARASLGLDPLELEIIYLRDGRSVRLAADEPLLGEARAAADGVAGGVRAGRFEARPERRRCSLCSYRLVCDAAL